MRLVYVQNPSGSSHRLARSHILNPADATRTVCGVGVTASWVRLAASAATCTNCDRMRGSAVQTLRFINSRKGK